MDEIILHHDPSSPFAEKVRSTRDDIEIRRTDPQVGEVVVHFPRAGFLVQPAA